MILEQEDEEEHKKPLSEDFTINEAEGSDIKVYERGIAGQTDFPCLCAKFDDNDEYIGKFHRKTFHLMNLYSLMPQQRSNRNT